MSLPPLSQPLLFLALVVLSPEVLGRSVQDDELGGLVVRHCVSCHAGAEAEAGLDLSEFDPGELDTALEMLSRVRAGEMPPGEAGAKMSSADRNSLLKGLAALLAGGAPDPGRPTLRRLDRSEYGSTVRDLLRIECDVERDLPMDASSEGFTNQGDVLFMDPELAEKISLATDRAVAQLLEDEAGLSRIGLHREEVDPVALRAWMQRAFRRPPLESEVSARVALWRQAGAHAAISSVLLSPYFLYRVEEDREAESPWPVSDWELATRLSYFIWGTMPDDELLSKASTGGLSDEAVLFAEVDRMLDDPRAISLGERFAARWLGVSEVPTQATDVRRFSGVNSWLKELMLRETVLFFHGIVREDRSLLELVDSDYTYLNKGLAAHYGLEGIEAGPMRRVELSDRRRGGVLTQASVLLATSQPLRTSPVLRGAWVLERLLASPSPPPPPDAGELPDDDQGGDGLSQRARLESHRADPKCASCHARMDPLGFALENYDGVGRWRDEDHLGPIDATAKLPGGVSMDGIEGLKDALLARSDDVARAVTEAMLVYALGRSLEPRDAPVVEEILAKLRGDGWGGRSLVKSVVQSYPFRYRRRSEL